jgi:hypothetical protein
MARGVYLAGAGAPQPFDLGIGLVDRLHLVGRSPAIGVIFHCERSMGRVYDFLRGIVGEAEHRIGISAGRADAPRQPKSRVEVVAIQRLEELQFLRQAMILRDHAVQLLQFTLQGCRAPVGLPQQAQGCVSEF